VAGRFPLYTDADVEGTLVKGLVKRGWDVVRAIDVYPEGTEDEVHFETASGAGRVLVGNDRDQLLIALRRAAEGRRFPGFITWRRKLHRSFAVGAFLDAFEDLAAKDDPFAFPIVYLQPRR
jgi:hypothetical protein